MREQRRALCVFTAGERFDLLQDAMSVVCGPKMCVFRKVHIVYLSECASVCLKPGSCACCPVCVCLCVCMCVCVCFWVFCLCVCMCNVSLLGWRQDWTAVAAWLSCEAGRRSDGRYGGGMFVEGACYTHTHTHTHTGTQTTHKHTHRLAGTILASEQRSQSHHHSFQEGQPQSHWTGFPTGEGRLEGEERKEGRERWRKRMFVSVCVGWGCTE